MNNQHNHKIIYLGTPEIAVKPLEALSNDTFEILGVITQPDKEKGRGKKKQASPIKEFALRHNLKVFEPKDKKELTDILKELKPDIGVLFAYGMIVPNEALEIPRKGIINIHPSLLPKYRGPSPIQNAILNGDDKTGVSIIKLGSEVDAGDVLKVKELDVEDQDTAETLSMKLSDLASQMIVKTIDGYLENKLKLMPQESSKATFTKMIRKEDGKIDWSKPALKIEREMRAYYPWPGSFTSWEGKKLKILECSLAEDLDLKPGSVAIEEDRVFVQTGNGALEVKTVQLEGKKPTSSKEFLNGYSRIDGSVLF